MPRYTMDALLDTVETVLREGSITSADEREHIEAFLERLDGPEFKFTPPGPEDDGRPVVCRNCGETTPIEDAHTTVDRVDDFAGAVTEVRRMYVCSDECASRFMAHLMEVGG